VAILGQTVLRECRHPEPVQRDGQSQGLWDAPYTPTRGPAQLNSDQLKNVLAEEQRIMDEFAPVYDAAMITNSYVYSLERKRFVKWLTGLAAEAGELSEMSVLDAGCASGGVLELMSGAGFGQLTGLDLSPKMLEVARGRELPRTEFLRGTIEHAPFQGQIFDVIVAAFTVHHLCEPSAFFKLVDNTLKPGGYFFVLEYDIDSGTIGLAGDGPRRRIGDTVRGLFAWKNRRTLAAKPPLVGQFNSAHRMMSFANLCDAMPNPDDYKVTHDSHGFVLPAFLPVLVEESAIDRGIVKVADAIDRRLKRSRTGLFQWVAGRRVTRQNHVQARS